MSSAEYIEELTKITNEYMQLPRNLTEDEINLIYSKLTENDKYILLYNLDHRDKFCIRLYQYKYPSIRELNENEVLYIANIDDFIIYEENDNYRFALREFDYDEQFYNPSLETFENIYSKVFRAAYLPHNNGLSNVVEVPQFERFIYKLISILEIYIDPEFYIYPLNEYLREHEESYNNTNNREEAETNNSDVNVSDYEEENSEMSIIEEVDENQEEINNANLSDCYEELLSDCDEGNITDFEEEEN